jgi:broad specificity phosphatase PhoE
MNTTIYLIRHGESQANERDLFLGHGDLDLTDTGRRQAEKTASFLSNLTPDAIYSSDLLRAYETAKRSADLFGLPIIRDEKLREIDAGEWDFRAFSDLERDFAKSYGIWCTDFGNARCDGGESVLSLKERVAAEVNCIARAHEGQTVLIFTHATPIRTFAAHCQKKRQENWKEIPWAPNASVTRVVFDGSEFCLMEYGNDSFMGTLSTQLPQNV